jgi:hypothetical protein
MAQPRTFWQYLKGPMHTFELHLSSTEVQLQEHRPDGGTPMVVRASLKDFVSGSLHAEVMASMNAAVLPEALESAKALLQASGNAGGPLKNAYLVQELKAAAEMPQRFREAFGHLSAVQLNWKPNPETWSVGECIDHLIVTNRSYFAQLEALSRGDKYVSFWEKLPILHGFWGRTILKATTEQVQKKGKTPSTFTPTRSTLPADIVEEYCRQHDQLLAKVRATDLVNHHETMITSPAASFITYSLHDAVRIIFQHERRHFNQAKALLSRPEFPKA